MGKSSYCGLLLVLLGTLWSGAASAAADSWFSGPYHISTSGEITPIEGSTYEREIFPWIAGVTEIVVYAGHNPTPGDAWATEVAFASNQQVIGRGTITYDSSDCLSFEGTPVFCNVAIPDDSLEFVIYTFPVFFRAQCVPTRDYLLAGRLNGDLLGGSPYDFTPTEFQVGRFELELSESRISPSAPLSQQRGHPRSHAPAISAETTTLEIRAMDGLGCNQLAPDETITVKSNIVPLSGGHEHFTESDEPGTGQWTDVTPPLDSVSPDQTEFEVTTPDGLVTAEYTAGSFGVREALNVFGFNEITGEGVHDSEEVDIRMRGANFLVPLNTSSPAFELRGTFRSTCDKGHNLDATNRRSHYMSVFGAATAQLLAVMFQEQTGIKLSYNDASLEYGGFFDDGTGGRNDLGDHCHENHRRGIDVDVNQGFAERASCPSGTTLHTCYLQVPGYPRGRKAIDVLTDIAVGRLRGYKFIERNPDNIHYRFLD